MTLDQVVADFSLTEVIDDLIAKGATDPHEIAPKVAKKVPEGAIRSLFVSLIEHAVAARMGQLRRRAFRFDDDDSPTATENAMIRWGGSADSARRTVFLPESECWKPMEDLTADECDELARDRAATAEKYASYAEKFRKTATTMRRRKVDRMGDLPSGTVKRIWG